MIMSPFVSDGDFLCNENQKVEALKKRLDDKN